MGLGGDLIFTAAAREIQREHPDKQIFLSKSAPKILKLFKRHQALWSVVFDHNPRFSREFTKNCILIDRSRKDISYVNKEYNDYYLFEKNRHAVDIICNNLGIIAKSHAPEIYFSNEEEVWWYSFKKNLPKKFIAFEPGGKIDFTPNRLYPTKFWKEIISFLSSEVILIQVGDGSSPDLNTKYNLSGKLTFRQTGMLIREASLFVGTIGGLMHLTQAVGTHGIIIHSGYEPLYMASYKEHTNLTKQVNCAPCGLKSPCPFNMKCMEISPNEVINAILSNI